MPITIDTAYHHPTAVRYVEDAAYPTFPYCPPKRYPEFREWHSQLDAENHVYALVRNILRDLDLDCANFDRPDWNPFGGLLGPGQARPDQAQLGTSRQPLRWIN